MVVELIITAVDSPNLPNLHLIADNPPEDNCWGSPSFSSIKFVESTGDKGIGSKNSESSAAWIYISIMRPTSTSSGYTLEIIGW